MSSGPTLALVDLQGRVLGRVRVLLKGARGDATRNGGDVGRLALFFGDARVDGAVELIFLQLSLDIRLRGLQLTGRH